MYFTFTVCQSFLCESLSLCYIFLLSLSDPPPFLFSVSLCFSLTQICWSAVSISVLPGGRIRHIRNLIQFIVIQSHCVPRGASGADPRVLVPDNSSPVAVKPGLQERIYALCEALGPYPLRLPANQPSVSNCQSATLSESERKSRNGKWISLMTVSLQEVRLA